MALSSEALFSTKCTRVGAKVLFYSSCHLRFVFWGGVLVWGVACYMLDSLMSVVILHSCKSAEKQLSFIFSE